MKAMVLTRKGAGRLDLREVPVPSPGEGQVLVRVKACGVCRTDLTSSTATCPIRCFRSCPAMRSSAWWSGSATAYRASPWATAWACRGSVICGICEFCTNGRENLCRNARYTGYQIDGGFAGYTVADARYCLRLPDTYGDAEATRCCAPGSSVPGVCDGRRWPPAGYLRLRRGGPPDRAGGRGAGTEVSRSRRPATRRRSSSREMGAVWAGPSTGPAPVPLDAAIIFAPVGPLVPEALRRTVPGGSVVCAGIYMSDIPSFPYRLLWEERIVRSVANLTVATAKPSSPSLPTSPCGRTCAPIRWATPTRHCTTCAPAASRAPPCSCPDWTPRRDARPRSLLRPIVR